MSQTLSDSAHRALEVCRCPLCVDPTSSTDQQAVVTVTVRQSEIDATFVRVFGAVPRPD